MSACDGIREDLSAYLDGELPQDARAACEAHLRACESCRNALAEVQGASAAVAALPRLQAPAGLAAKIHQEALVQPLPRDFSAVEKKAARRPAPVPYYTFWRPALFGVAALIMLIVLGFVVLPALTSHSPRVAARDSRSKEATRSAGAPVTRQAAPPRAAAAPAEAKTAGALSAEPRAAEGAAAQPPSPARDIADPGRFAASEGLRKGKRAKSVAAAPGGPPPAATGAAPAPGAVAGAPLGVVTAPPAPKNAPAKASADALQARRGLAQTQTLGKLKDAARDEKGALLVEEAQVEKESAAKGGVSEKRKAGGFRADDSATQLLKQQAPEKPGLAAQNALDAAQEKRRGGEGGVATRDRDSAQTETDGAKREAQTGQAVAERTGKLAATTPAPAPAADKQIAPGGGAGNKNAGIANGRKADGFAGADRPAAPAPEAPAQAQRQIGQGRTFGAGAAYKAGESAALVVFQTQDQERLLSQLRELARENGARWEVAASPVMRAAKKADARDEEQHEIAAGKAGPGGPGEYEIVTTPEHRAELLAQLLALRSAQPAFDEARLQLGVRARTPTAGAGAGVQPGEPPATAQKEAKKVAGAERAEAEQLDRKQPESKPAATASQALPFAADAGKQAGGPAQEARIRIRIEILQTK